VCVTHHEGSGFNVYRNKGRPSTETVERMSVPGALEAHVQELRREMNYKDGTEVVLLQMK